MNDVAEGGVVLWYKRTCIEGDAALNMTDFDAESRVNGVLRRVGYVLALTFANDAEYAADFVRAFPMPIVRHVFDDATPPTLYQLFTPSQRVEIETWFAARGVVIART